MQTAFNGENKRNQSQEEIAVRVKQKGSCVYHFLPSFDGGNRCTQARSAARSIPMAPEAQPESIFIAALLLVAALALALVAEAAEEAGLQGGQT